MKSRTVPITKSKLLLNVGDGPTESGWKSLDSDNYGRIRNQWMFSCYSVFHFLFQPANGGEILKCNSEKKIQWLISLLLIILTFFWRRGRERKRESRRILLFTAVVSCRNNSTETVEMTFLCTHPKGWSSKNGRRQTTDWNSFINECDTGTRY